jgi:hypothetical protein
VPRYPFLSDEWLVAVRDVVDRHDVEVPPSVAVAINLVVTSTPFGDDRMLHAGTRDGKSDWGSGHVPDSDLTLTTDYDTARAIFMSGDPQVAMQSFFDGKVKVQGDLTKLMAAQMAGAGPGAPGLAEELSAITE